MNTVMSNQNAVDYMIKSTEYIMAAVCNSHPAMIAISNNPNTMEKLLLDTNWPAKLNTSPYYYEINSKTIKVPTMGSNTYPSGQCFSTTPYSGSYDTYLAFDGNPSSDFAYWGNGPAYIGYKFTTPVHVYRFELNQRVTGSEGFSDATLYCSDDGVNYTKASDTITLIRSTALQSYTTNYNSGKHLYWKIVSTSRIRFKWWIRKFTILRNIIYIKLTIYKEKE